MTSPPPEPLDAPAEDAKPARPTRRPIERSCYVHEDDAFAPAPPGARCRSRYVTRFGTFANGYMRRDHSLDKDGRCIFCGSIPLAAVRPAASFRRR